MSAVAPPASTRDTTRSTKEAWHAMDHDAVAEALHSRPGGLTETEAATRLAIVGPNTLPATPPPPAWLILVRQFRSPLIYVLGIAAAVSLLIGETTDAAFIVAVLTINALIGGYQEWRAERRTQALQRLLRVVAKVERDGDVTEVDAADVVPGDICWLESGDRVPADLRLLRTHGVEIDESLLTGESLAVSKDAAWSGSADAALADRRNMAFAGAVMAHGRARGMVVATGAQTHVGRLALDIQSAAGGKPPLLLRLERFTRVVGIAVLSIAALIAVVGVLVQGQTISEMFLFAVALAVSAIPEGLPVAITVALAIATTRMAKRGVIVRKLGAVEGLGSCTMIASDKTGTLTCNALTVRHISLVDGSKYEASGEGFEPDGLILSQGDAVTLDDHPALASLLRCAVLCNEGDLHRRDHQWHWRGDPTDIALLTLGAKAGMRRPALLEQMPTINEIPFEPEHRFAASFHSADGGGLVFVKGAPERVLSMCRDTDAERWQHEAETLADAGCRVLAFAKGHVDTDMDPTAPPPPPSGLEFIGLVGMIDPLRPGVREAIAACRASGLEVAMVTGDHPVTALAIGRDLGLVDDRAMVVSGAMIEAANDGELDEYVRSARLFARVAPHQKLRIVEAAQRNAHFVAVTGDGVNDAPALRRANIGVAMGRSGTDVARDASDMVISDDNFATIVAGVEEGRVAYNNIRNVIYLLVSTGAAEVVLVLLAISMDTPLPLLPVQLLWLNLVTNGVQDVALAFEPALGDELSKRPRPSREPIFNRLMIERTLIGALVMGVVAFCAFAWMLDAGWDLHAARNGVLLLMVLFENIHIGNCRSETISALRMSPLRVPLLLFATIIAQTIHMVGIFTPLGQTLLDTRPINLSQWFALLALSLTVFAAIEIHKLTWAMRHREGASQQHEP